MTTTATAAATAVQNIADGDAAEQAEKGGELLFCGVTDWEAAGRRNTTDTNLFSPTKLQPLLGVSIRFIASGCSSCHCVALDVEGRCYTWGRNEKGQLGHGDLIQRDNPTVVSGLSKYRIIKAGAGRSHTTVVSDDGQSLSFGWNKHGQLGLGSLKNECELSPVKSLVSGVKNVSCGGDFTAWLTSVEGASIFTAGLPQYGQLGHGEDNEYNTKESSVRLAYEPQSRPRAIASLSGETVVKIACGTNHSVAVDANGIVYTWGYGGHGRLGHREQKDEWIPRLIHFFQRNNVLPPDAVISAGSTNSSCTAAGGQLYMWGKLKATGDNWMYPKPLMDLSGWNIRCMDSGGMHHFVGADTSCISWGQGQCGELGYGPFAPKSSANPKKVDSLESSHVIGVACGQNHSMMIVDRTNGGDLIDQLEVFEGKAPVEQGAGGGKKVEVKTGKKGTPKVKDVPPPRDDSESEEEAYREEEEEEAEEEEEGDSSEDDERVAKKKKRRSGRKPSSRGGRGRPPPKGKVGSAPSGGPTRTSGQKRGRK